MKHHTDDLIKSLDEAIEIFTKHSIRSSSQGKFLQMQNTILTDMKDLRSRLNLERELTIQKHKDVHGNGDEA